MALFVINCSRFRYRYVYLDGSLLPIVALSQAPLWVQRWLLATNCRIELSTAMGTKMALLVINCSRFRYRYVYLDGSLLPIVALR